MSRPKGSKNKKTIDKLKALYGIDKTTKNVGKNDNNDTKNVGDKPKRVRRTKAQLMADGYYDKDKKDKEKEKRKGDKKDNSELFVSYAKTIEQLSDYFIQMAKEKGKENWEQDFRNDYEKGQKIYYVKINNLCHSKELLELYVGTIYSKVMVCWEDKGASYSIGIDDMDKIFLTEKEAKKYYQKVRVE